MEELDQVVRAVLAGDRERYRVLVERCEVPVRVVLAAMLPDTVAVDDVVHEVFLTAFLKLREYRTGTDLIAWLKAIARNLALNERRRWLRLQSMKRRYRGQIEELLVPMVDETADAVSPDVLAALRGCIEKLGEPARQLVRRHYLEGVGYEDLVRTTGRTAGWARLVLFRARAALARCLAEGGAMSMKSMKGELPEWQGTA